MLTGKNSVRYNEVVKQGICPECKGTRLNPKVLACRIGDKNIADCCNMQIDELVEYIGTIHDEAVNPVLEAIKENLQNLLAIGLGYLILT